VTGEFDGVMQWAPETPTNRPPMSYPPRVVASSAFIREVKQALNIEDDNQARDAADWIIDKMERFGARTAEGVFDLKGNGPKCSWCGMIWPLCGHNHQSEVDFGEDDSGGTPDAA
jgi:hypothetical protein